VYVYASPKELIVEKAIVLGIFIAITAYGVSTVSKVAGKALDPCSRIAARTNYTISCK
jgi:hypothetical protein